MTAASHVLSTRRSTAPSADPVPLSPVQVSEVRVQELVTKLTVAQKKSLPSLHSRAAAVTSPRSLTSAAAVFVVLRAEGGVGLDGFHSLVSALSVKKEEEKEDGAAPAAAASASLHPKFAAAAPRPLPNNLPRKMEKGRRGESKSEQPSTHSRRFRTRFQRILDPFSTAPALAGLSTSSQRSFSPLCAQEATRLTPTAPHQRGDWREGVRERSSRVAASTIERSQHVYCIADACGCSISSCIAASLFSPRTSPSSASCAVWMAVSSVAPSTPPPGTKRRR